MHWVHLLLSHDHVQYISFKHQLIGQKYVYMLWTYEAIAPL